MGAGMGDTSFALPGEETAVHPRQGLKTLATSVRPPGEGWVRNARPKRPRYPPPLTFTRRGTDNTL